LKRTVLAAATVAALTAGTLGATAPAALAKPPVDHGTHGHGTTTHGHGHADHGNHQLQKAQRKVQREITRKDRKLASVLTFHGFEVLGADDAATVSANVATDRATLAGLGEQAAAATTLDEVRAIAAQVKALNPATYLVAVNKLRHADAASNEAADLTASIADLSARADALEAAGVDVTDVRAGLDAATTSLADAVTAASTAAELAAALTSASTTTEVQAAKDAAAAAAAAFEDVATQVETITAAVEALEASASTSGTDPVTP
jgi:hypothetical protein